MDTWDYRKHWEALGEVDPLWAVLLADEMRHGKWDIEKFFAHGEHEISEFETKMNHLGLPESRHLALDFGCGVGRLTRALASRFERVAGIDISPSMLDKARELNPDLHNIKLTLNTNKDLGIFPSDTFDLVYSSIVLQHITESNEIETYIREFIRVVKPGGLVAFQLPTKRYLKARLNLRRRAYLALQALGFSQRFLLEKLELSPVHMSAIPEANVVALLKEAGGRLVDRQSVDSGGPHVESLFYCVTKGPR